MMENHINLHSELALCQGVIKLFEIQKLLHLFMLMYEKNKDKHK